MYNANFRIDRTMPSNDLNRDVTVNGYDDMISAPATHAPRRRRRQSLHTQSRMPVSIDFVTQYRFLQPPVL